MDQNIQIKLKKVDDNTASCDGDGTHPLIYLDISEGRVVTCPYCSRQFIKNDEKH